MSQKLREDPQPDIQRVLIYRLGSLGDNIVALPCYHRIALVFPNAERRLLTNIPVHAKAPAAAAVLGDSGLIHGYMQYPVGMRSPREILRLWGEIRRFRPQVLIYLSSLRGYRAARRDRLFFRLCGIRTTIGFPQSEAECFRRQLPGSSDFEPEAARLARAIGAIGSPDLKDPSNWEMKLNVPERARADEVKQELKGARFLVASVGTKMQSKDWGEENWTALLTKMAECLPDYKLVLIGSAEEAGVSERSAQAWQDRGLNLCGALPPRESAALLAAAEMFVGHDSGPMHLAAAVGVPCVAIFAARNLPQVWFPYGEHHRVMYHLTDCAGCELEDCIEQKKKCILSITVDEVLTAVLATFKAVGEQPRSLGL